MSEEQLFSAFANALLSGNWILLAALVTVLVVSVARVVLQKRFPFFASDFGGALLALVVGMSSAVAVALLGGATFSGELVLGALKATFTAMGGYVAFRKLASPYVDELIAWFLLKQKDN